MVRKIKVRTALNIHKYRDKWFLDDYSVNPYSGCSFNCVYCYIRGWRRKSIETPISAKINVPEILEGQLKTRANKDKYGIIALSTSTEPYMKMEEKFQLTRKTLEVISRYRFPVHILTKSILVLRDIDLLKEIDRNAILPEDLRILKRGVIVTFSISTLDESLSSIVEPGYAGAAKEDGSNEDVQKGRTFDRYSFHSCFAFSVGFRGKTQRDDKNSQRLWGRLCFCWCTDSLRR